MKFIKLTEANKEGKTILINAEHITVVHKGRDGVDTHVRMHGQGVSKEGVLKNEYYFVKESVEQIEELLNVQQ